LKTIRSQKHLLNKSSLTGGVGVGVGVGAGVGIEEFAAVNAFLAQSLPTTPITKKKLVS
jgi:hypothetical protein